MQYLDTDLDNLMSIVDFYYRGKFKNYSPSMRTKDPNDLDFILFEQVTNQSLVIRLNVSRELYDN